MDLELEFEYDALLNAPVVTGPACFGTRMILTVKEGTVRGERISGKLLPGGGDWLLADGQGYGHVDVRAQLETDDGALIYVQYFGMLEMNDKLQNALATGSETQFSDQYFRTTPRLETGDPRYAWVNHTVFVAEGRAIEGLGVEYRVYRVT